MNNDPTQGINAGVGSAPRARGGWHPALGSREASWKRGRLGVLREELPRQEETPFQAEGTAAAKAPIGEQVWFGWTRAQVGSL